jgi:hypothetical protein
MTKPFRIRSDALRRKLETINSRPGHPLQAEITVTVHGRTSLGRAWPTRFRMSLDLLFGQASEADLFRKIQDAIESTYLSDCHMARRMAVEASMGERDVERRAEHAAWEAQRSELTFTAKRPLKKRSKKGCDT